MTLWGAGGPPQACCWPLAARKAFFSGQVGNGKAARPFPAIREPLPRGTGLFLAQVTHSGSRRLFSGANWSFGPGKGSLPRRTDQIGRRICCSPVLWHVSPHSQQSFLSQCLWPAELEDQDAVLASSRYNPAPGPTGRPRSIQTTSSNVQTIRKVTVYGSIVAITVPIPALAW